MLLVGSKALNAYLKLGRVIHDWDFWMSDAEASEFDNKYSDKKVKMTDFSTLYDIDGTIVEVKSESQFETTDGHIFDLTKFDGFYENIETPWGKARVPCIQFIYDMKKATALCIDEWKHHYDLKLIEECYGHEIEKDSDLFEDRLKETKARIARSEKNKFEFFHKTALGDQKISGIPEYILHDRLHEMIADLTGIGLPTYLRITDGDVSISLDQFNKLSHYQKLCLMVEESLVLALERWFIPQMIENGINHKLIPKFYSNNEASPSYLLLKHVNIKGLIGEKDYITQFGRDNFADIEKLWIVMKDRIHGNGGFPQWFYNELFEIREKYRNGEKVGFHHAKKENEEKTNQKGS